MPDVNPTQSRGSGAPYGPFGDILLAANFDDPQKRMGKEYGRKLMARIYKEQKNESSTFYWGGRNVRMFDVWQWAMGRQDMKQFFDFVGVDGNKAYSNVDYTQNRIGPQFLETLVNSICQTDSYPNVTAIDDESMQQKEALKKEALFRMHESETINMLQQKAGFPLEAPNAYVPDDELMAEVYFELEHRLPKEYNMEKCLGHVMDDNEWGTIYRDIVRYLIALNHGCTKVERLPNGFIGIKYCIIPNVIYNFFMTQSGKRELSYIGEVYTLKIRDLRKLYSKYLTEKEIYEIAMDANQYNNSNRFYYYWNDSYLYATDRPYDDYGIQVLDLEVKLFDTDYYVSKTNSYGKEYIQPKKGKPNPTSDKASVIEKGKFTVYRGIYAMKSDRMIYWGLPDLTIKPFQDISESLFSYSIQIPNNDGDYVPSLFERALEPLREYQLLKLKRKQLVAEMVPAGYSIDVETARDIDLGNGNKIGWEEVLKIRNQKGVVLWSSRGLNPNEINREPPIIEMANAGSVAQLNELTNLMDRCYAEIRGVLGVPMYRDGTDLKPRMGQQVIENQAAASNNVTDFINHAAQKLMEETLYKVCLLKWDDFVLKEGQDEYLNTIFRVKVELKPTDYEREKVEQQITVAMQEGLINYKDALYIRNIKNFKLQQLYLASVVEKNKREAAKAQQDVAQQNAQAAAQNNQQQAENELKLLQAKAQIEQESERKKTESLEKLAIIQGIFAIAAKSPTGEIPMYLQPLAQQVLKNISLPITAENIEMQGGFNAMLNAQNAQTQQSPQEQQMQNAPQPEQQQAQ